MAGQPSEDSLHALVDKAEAALEKRRWARAADLYKRAALQASALYPHDSLVTVENKYIEADARQGQADEPGVSIAEQRALYEEAWALVREGMEVVLRRHGSDTLDFNKCRPDEVQYVTRRLTSRLLDGDAAQRGRVLETAASIASSFGLCMAIRLAIRLSRLCLYRMHCRFFGVPQPSLPAPERGIAEKFVLQSLDSLASLRAVTMVPIMGEPEFVHAVQQLLASPAVMETSFHTALEARWTSPDVVASLQRHGTVERSTAVYNNMLAASEAAQRADVAEHGLLVCALPGCDKREVTVHEFKVCSACRAVAYCSAEHGGLHWAGGHKHECKELKAAGAKPARAV